jgi:hypothetical protein
MEAEDWLKSIVKKLEIAQCTDQEKVLLQHINYLGPLLNGGKCTTTLTRMLVLSPRMSSKLDLELTMYLVVRSN